MLQSNRRGKFYINCGITNDEEYQNCGEIFALYIISKYKGNGFGRNLVENAKKAEAAGADFVGDVDMLEKMNRRIEVLYDREHTIGHSYFMSLNENNSIEGLAEIFKNKILHNMIIL